MKTKALKKLIFILPLFVLGYFLPACTPDTETENISPREITLNSYTGGDSYKDCYKCDQTRNIIKGSGGEEVIMGTLQVCQKGDQLCFTYTAADGRRINSIDIGFWPSLSAIEGDYPNPSPNSFQLNFRGYTSPICVSLSDIAEYVGIADLSGRTVVIATNVQLTGAAGGAEGGQGWVGTLVNSGRYPFDRYFTFTFCKKDKDKDHDKDKCNKTQGYWKTHGPGDCGKGNNANEWPVTTLKLGTVSYTSAQLCSILNTPVAGNGLISLAHQLIAAKLNAAKYGTYDRAIRQADELIGNLVVGSDYLSPAQVSSLVEALTAFNESGKCAKEKDKY